MCAVTLRHASNSHWHTFNCRSLHPTIFKFYKQNFERTHDITSTTPPYFESFFYLPKYLVRLIRTIFISAILYRYPSNSRPFEKSRTFFPARIILYIFGYLEILVDRRRCSCYDLLDFSFQDTFSGHIFSELLFMSVLDCGQNEASKATPISRVVVCTLEDAFNSLKCNYRLSNWMKSVQLRDTIRWGRGFGVRNLN